MSSTLALSTEQSFFPRRRAVSNPTRGDAADLALAVVHRVEALVLAGGVLAAPARLPEIDVAGELADDHEVEPGDHLGLQRRDAASSG